MNILNIGTHFPANHYRITNSSTKNSAETFSITGQSPTWTASSWERFMDDLAKNMTDEEFADRLQLGCGSQISTEKKINWQATSENELTQDQIDYLKSAYDLQNMDTQDYYNLIADLTNMNVISGQDTAKQHAGVLPIGVLPPSNTGMGERSGSNGDYSVFSGNIYQIILSRANGISHTLDLFNNSIPQGNAKNYLEFKEYFEDQSRIYGRMIDIFDQLM